VAMGAKFVNMSTHRGVVDEVFHSNLTRISIQFCEFFGMVDHLYISIQFSQVPTLMWCFSMVIFG